MFEIVERHLVGGHAEMLDDAMLAALGKLEKKFATASGGGQGWFVLLLRFR